MITQTFDLDVIPGAVPVTVHLKQYQSEGFLIFHLFSRHGVLDIGLTSVDCIIRGTKKDGNGYSKYGSITHIESDGNGCTVKFEIDEQITAIAGMNPFEIVLTDSDGRTVTATFFLDVQRAALDSDTISSESAIHEIQQVVTEYINAHPDVLQMLTIGVVHDGQGNVEILPRNIIPDADLMEF